MRPAIRQAIVLMAVTLAAADARARDDASRAEIVGALVHTRVAVEMDRVPLREALRMIGDAAGVRIVPHFEGGPNPRDINPEHPIDLRAEDVSALDALEMIIDRAALFDSCTWQLKEYSIEVGRCARLAKSPPMSRILDLTDMLIDPPYFQAGGMPIDAAAFDEHSHRAASLYFGHWRERKSSEDLAKELVRGIVEIVDPGNWDCADTLQRALPTGPAVRSLAGENHRAVGTVRMPQTRQLLIAAPDFMLRRATGLGIGAVPDVSEEEIAARNGRAVWGDSFVRVLRVDPTPVSFGAALIDSSTHARAAGAPRQGPPRLLAGSNLQEQMARRMVASLEDTVFDVNYDGAPLSDVLADIAFRTGVQVIPRFADDAVGFGLSRRSTITLRLAGLPARTILEEVLAQCESVGSECAWQVRRGYIEVGTKGRLSLPAARDTRVYFVRDLMFQAQNMNERRKPSEVFELENVETIITVVEPDAWDWGQPLKGLETAPSDGQQVGGEGLTSQPSIPADPAPARPIEKEFVVHPAPAIIRHWRDAIIVNAPDYIHRQLIDR